jgi:hypothetical protein
MILCMPGSLPKLRLPTCLSACLFAVYVLPYTSWFNPGTVHLFMFNCDNGAIMRLTPSNTWSQYRDIPSSLWPTPGFCGAMSMAGTATMLMLEPEAGYAAEVVMFGGYRRGNRKCCSPCGAAAACRCCWHYLLRQLACMRVSCLMLYIWL